MTINQIKRQLHEAIDETDDQELLKEINFILETSKSGSSDEEWEQLPQEVKNAIEEVLDQANKGEAIPDSEFRKRFAKWFSK